jgi:hypothetical protein
MVPHTAKRRSRPLGDEGAVDVADVRSLAVQLFHRFGALCMEPEEPLGRDPGPALPNQVGRHTGLPSHPTLLPPRGTGIL